MIFALDINGFSLFWKRMRNRYEGNQDIVLRSTDGTGTPRVI